MMITVGCELGARLHSGLHLPKHYGLLIISSFIIFVGELLCLCLLLFAEDVLDCVFASKAHFRTDWLRRFDHKMLLDLLLSHLATIRHDRMPVERLVDQVECLSVRQFCLLGDVTTTSFLSLRTSVSQPHLVCLYFLLVL
jgi:hypothetical protein